MAIHAPPLTQSVMQTFGFFFHLSHFLSHKKRVSISTSFTETFFPILYLEAVMAQLHTHAIGSTLSNTLCAHTPPASPPLNTAVSAVANQVAVVVAAVLVA